MKDAPFVLAPDGVFKTCPVLCRWPALVTPRPSKNPEQKPTYQVTPVFDGTEVQWLTGFSQALNNFTLQKMGMSPQQVMDEYGADYMPVRRNSIPKRARHAGIKERPNGIHFGAKTQYPLTGANLVDRHGATMAGGREADVYDGCVIIAACSFYTYNHMKSGKRGIGINLVGLQKVGDGPRIASGGGNPDFGPADEYNAPGFDPAANFQPAAPVGGFGAQTPGDHGPIATVQHNAPQPAPTQPGGTSGFGW